MAADLERRRDRLWLLPALLLIVYALPWVIAPAAALSFGGYDLAEWVSLAPAIRGGNPPLLAPFLLRFPLAVITLLAALAGGDGRFSRRWWLAAAAVALLAVAQLPPPEYLGSARGDPNYGQQFALAIISVIGGLGLLIARPGRLRSLLAALLAAAGGVAAAAGWLQAQALLASFGAAAQPGAGAWLTPLVFLGGAALLVVRRAGNQKE